MRSRSFGKRLLVFSTHGSIITISPEIKLVHGGYHKSLKKFWKGTSYF